MYGPEIFARFVSSQRILDAYGNSWQYNSQSDSHSKAACWGVAFDLLLQSAMLRSHARDGKIILGINHTLVDYRTGRPKDLDLVIARPASSVVDTSRSFKKQAESYGLVFAPEEQVALDGLPDVFGGQVGAVNIALESKAVMTKHVSALPRLHDELAASEECVHGASGNALAIAYVQINASPIFAPSPSNRHSITDDRPVVMRKNTQPRSVEAVLEKLTRLKRRSAVSESGFDGIGVTVVDFKNLGGPVRLVTKPPAPNPGDSYHYETMIVRMANEYDARFAGI